MARLITFWPPGQSLRCRRVPGDESRTALGRFVDLDEHLAMLTVEFAGATELELHHARTIVLLRRGLNLRRNRARFYRFWYWHGRFLANQLSSRWLVSAADTFVDHPRNPTEQATAMAAVLLVNTVKLYETERHQLGQLSSAPLVKTHGDPSPLFDGLTTYLVGRGDLITNLQERLGRVNRRGRPANLILTELMRRLQLHNTIYRRCTDVA